MTGIFLDSFIAVILAVLVAFLLWLGRQNLPIPSRGWNWIIVGFSLLLFAELIHIAPHFDSLDRFAIILEKAIGTLGGVLALAVGLVLLTPGVRDILEETSMRKRAEEALRESEERFRDIAATASDRFWEMDENLRFTSFIEYTGSKTSPALEHFIGRTRWEAVGADPENDDKWRRHREDHLARRPYRDFQFAVTGEDAVTNHLSVSGMPVFDSNDRARQPVHDLQAVHAGHAKVENDEIEAPFQVKGLHPAGIRRAHEVFVAFLPQHLLKKQDVGRIVVDDEDSRLVGFIATHDSSS